MNILFLHQKFPAQFIHLAQAMAAQGHKCLALVPEANLRLRVIPTVTYAFAAEEIPQNDPGGHFAMSAFRGSAAAHAMFRLSQAGFVPDIVVGHCGWGETLFVRDVWPKTRIIVYAEFFYSSTGADSGFDMEFSNPPTLAAAVKIRARNAAMLQALVDADRAVAPTNWQASRFPTEIQRKMEIVHEGIHTDLARPDARAHIRLGRNKLTLHPGDEVVTFVSRNLEPYRGYHSFMRALPKILGERPKARAVIVGGDKVSYGPSIKGQSWKTRFLQEVSAQIDMSRI